MKERKKHKNNSHRQVHQSLQIEGCRFPLAEALGEVGLPLSLRDTDC